MFIEGRIHVFFMDREAQYLINFSDVDQRKLADFLNYHTRIEGNPQAPEAGNFPLRRLQKAFTIP